jgi:hypothetical protein
MKPSEVGKGIDFKFLNAILEKAEKWRYHGEFLGHAERVSVLAFNCVKLNYSKEYTLYLFDRQIELEKRRGRLLRAMTYELFIIPFREVN